jgi:hypothetical protein
MTATASAPVDSFFLLQFLEVARPVASEPTGGAETETETGDGTGPTKKDYVEFGREK